MVVRGVSAATEDAVSYRMALEIPGGSSAWREYSFPVKPEGWSEVHTTLRGHDFGETFSTHVPLTEARAVRVPMIGEASVDLPALKSYVGGELRVGATDQSPAREPKLSRITPAEMPPLAVAYEPFQLVLLLCSTLESAPEGAIDALGDWVGSGGTLAAFSGPAWAGGVPEKLRALLGIELQGNDRRIALAEGSREVEDGVAIVSRPGLGSATTFTLLQGTGGASVFPSPAGAPSVYRALDACFGRAVSFTGDSGAGLRAIEHQIGLSLYLLAGVRLPSRGAVVLGLLVYALLGFVVPAWIFKRLGRREWSFAVMVAAAIAAAFAIYQLGVFSSIGGAEVDEVSIVRMAPGSAVVRAASYLGLISPGFDTIGIAAPGALPHPLRSERREPWRRG